MKILNRYLTVASALSLIIATGCTSTQITEHPALPPGVPDFTKGEGPPIEKAHPSWVLHIGRALAGYAHVNKYRNCDDGRQILVTRVPSFSSVRRELKVGDVILGVNGKYFSRNAIHELRETSIPARKNFGSFDVILWRKGWKKERNVTLTLRRHLPVDFTKGDKEGEECDWNLGATGARGFMDGLNVHSYVTRQILITAVENGSPADGILKRGDVIIGLNGKEFSSDARRRFGEALAKAETKGEGGKLNLLIWRKGETTDVLIQLPVLGAYSETTPSNCEKSEKILDQACGYLIRNKIIEKGKLMHAQRQLAALALLSTGEEAHFKIAKQHILTLAKAVDESGECPPRWAYNCWGWAYANLMLTEYYLLTKDETVLNSIRKLSSLLIRLQSTAGTWGHGINDPKTKRVLGYGAMNQVGNVCLISLVLAKKCDATIPEIDKAVHLGSSYLRQFIDLSEVFYGDYARLGTRHDDNGKCSSAAVALALMGDKEAGDYFSRMTIASHDYREFGHTGNWWSFLWGPLGASRSGREGCSAFLKELAYLHDMERRWDGGFTYQGKLNIALKSGKEHKNKGWDTTGCRILMYTLPKKRLYITGKDGFSAGIPAEDIAGLVEDGKRPTSDLLTHDQKYDDLSVDELMERLQRWSPPVRSWAAASLSNKDAVSVSDLMAMLKSDKRYARYGACRALQLLGPKASSAVDQLIECLDGDDSRLTIYAALALGEIGDMKSSTPLLNLAIRDRKDDPRQHVRRFSAVALFGKKGLLRYSIDGVDRNLLNSAIQAILACPGGGDRTMAATVLTKLTPDELQPLWPDMIRALKQCAPTDIGSASGVRVTVAMLMKEHNTDGGAEALWTFFKNQKMHGSEKGRNRAIMVALASYGAKAKHLLPQMEAYLKLIKNPPEHTDPFAPNPNPHFYPAQILHLTEAIETIKAAK